MNQGFVSGAVFALSLILTFGIAVIARRSGRESITDDLSGRTLSRWLIGLSAGATANSGFVVAGAVGLGYQYGIQWVMFPIAWLLGDLVFWRWFPQRITAVGHHSGAVTISELLRYGLSGRWASSISVLATVVIVFGLAGYTAAQWQAGQTFLTGAFELSANAALGLFALLIIAYSSIGGFRGSVYVDTFQAILRLTGTLLVLISVIWISAREPEFRSNIVSAGPGFLNPLPGASLVGSVGFIAGWAAAALGFGLGQPQIVSRYLASCSPDETRAARWIYIGFVQITWVAMTVFGVLLRGIMPDIAEPEAGLSVFVKANLTSVLAGVIVADVFGVIASTANSLLISMAQSIKRDIVEHFFPAGARLASLTNLTLVAGPVTIAVTAAADSTVAGLAMSSVSMIGAGLAVPVMIKVMRWRHTGASLNGALVVGIASAVAWVHFGLSEYLNEAAVGMLLSAVANFALLRASKTTDRGRPATSGRTSTS